MINTGRLRADHPLSAVLRRCGVNVPDGPGVRSEWRCHCPLPTHPAPANPAKNRPSFAVHLSGRRAGHWHCFACDTGGDAIDLVQAYAQVGFRQAVQMIEAVAPIPRGADPNLHLRPAARSADGALRWDAKPGSDADSPDLHRTPPNTLYRALSVAWRYYSLDILAATARARIAERAIPVDALEVTEGRVLAGHTPRSPTGLYAHMRRRGFDDDQLVDAGLIRRRPDGTIRDRFTHRVLLPVRDAKDRVIGLIGRDIFGGERPKYLNTPGTAIYDKSRQCYSPTRIPDSPADHLTVVEGPFDALAVSAWAASEALDVVTVSPTGVALTAHHRATIAAHTACPPVLCADGDRAGRIATAKWVTAMTMDGHEVFATTLPEPYDPADWLAERQSNGLTAFLRPDHPGVPDQVAPCHSGRHLASLAMEDGGQPAEALAALGRVGAHLGSEGSRRRFAHEASLGLAAAGLGPDGWLERALEARLDAVRSAGSEPAPPATHVSAEV